MKKRIVYVKRAIILFVMVWVGAAAHSQNRSLFRERLIMDYGINTFVKFNEDTPIGLQARWGYHVTQRIGLFANMEGNLIHHHQGRGIGDYQASNNWGGGVTFRLKEAKDGYLSGFKTIDVYAACGTTLGHYAWKYTLYDLGISIGLAKHFTPTLGLGYKIMDSRNDNVKSFNGFYVSLGFRL